MIHNNIRELFMRRFKIKPLCALLLSAPAATATAVNLGNDGTGQVLIYPYYTVRTAGPGDWATYLNLVNHTSDTKALRLRFREGKNGRSVFDMNLYIGAGDAWAGAVSKTPDGTQLMSADRSCITASGSYAQSVSAAKLSPAFSNAMYVGPSTTQGIFDGIDGEDTSLDRTREGFFEIIEMGVVTSPPIINGLKHDASGVPANCGVVANIDAGVIGAPRGGISGGASLIHVLKGADFSYDPVVLEDFYRPAQPGDNLWTAAGNRLPDLSQATPVSRIMYLHEAGMVANPFGAADASGFRGTDLLETSWSRGIDAVSAVLARASVKNSYVLDPDTQSSTDWIVTFPTKHFYVSANAPGSSILNDPNGSQLLYPFHNYFWTGGALDPVTFSTYDREEQIFFCDTCSSGVPKPATEGFRTRWQTNVGTFSVRASILESTGTLLGSANRLQSLYFANLTPFSDVRVPSSAPNGFATLLFLSSLPLAGASTTTGTPESYFGLPVVGFMVQDFTNMNVTINGLPSAASYGGNFNHRYKRLITGGKVRP